MAFFSWAKPNKKLALLSAISAALRDTSFNLSPASLEDAETQRDLISEREIKQKTLETTSFFFLFLREAH